MAKSFDELADRTMSKDARRRARERAKEMMASMFIRQMRESLQISQTEIAKRLGIKQPTYSKIESAQHDLQIDTLRRVVEAMGGELDVVARFPKARVKVADVLRQYKAPSAPVHVELV